MLTVVAEHQGRLIGTFGLHHGETPDIVAFCYLLVDPELHQSGIGTTLFLAALAMLPERPESFSVRISALPKATNFYRRFGFQFLGRDEAPEGEFCFFAHLPVSCAVVGRCRALLAGINATLPPAPYHIPSWSEPAPAGADC